MILDVNIQTAAEQRTELSPRRGFASLGYWFVRFAEPRSGDRKFITRVPPITYHRCRPFRACSPQGHWPKARKAWPWA